MNLDDFVQWFRGTMVLNKDDTVTEFSEYLQQETLTDYLAIVDKIKVYRPKPGLYPVAGTVLLVSWPTMRQYRRGAHPDNCSVTFFLKRDRLWQNSPRYGISLAKVYAFVATSGYPKTVRKAFKRIAKVEAELGRPAKGYPINRYLCLERISMQAFNIRSLDDIVGEVIIDPDTGEPGVVVFDSKYKYLEEPDAS